MKKLMLIVVVIMVLLSGCGKTSRQQAVEKMFYDTTRIGYCLFYRAKMSAMPVHFDSAVAEMEEETTLY